jgi:hypothetical protein
MNTRKRSGRPAKGSADLKNETIPIRVDALEKQAFRVAAGVAGVGLSAWARERLRRAAVRELEQASLPIAFLQPIDMEGEKSG